MDKTILNYLIYIKDKAIRKEAIYEYNHRKSNLDRPSEINSIADALMYAFLWEDTKEGKIFWRKIYTELRNQ